jgi:hypothetical protein
MGRLADEELDHEGEIGNVAEIAGEHVAIAGEPERTVIVDHVVGDEFTQGIEVAPVEAGDIGAVVRGEFGCIQVRLGRLIVGWVRRAAP